MVIIKCFTLYMGGNHVAHDKFKLIQFKLVNDFVQHFSKGPGLSQLICACVLEGGGGDCV